MSKITAAPAAPAAPESLYYSEKQLAQMLGRSIRCLRWWNQERKGPPRIRVGRVILYSKESVHAWLRSHESRPEGDSRPYARRRRKAVAR